MNRLNRSEIHKLLLAPLGKRINQEVVERWSASFWELTKKPRNLTSHEEPFVMMFPPPNITGNLHLGHALTAAVQDALMRQRRMDGKRAIFIPGFDHAGLATQNIVEKLLWHQKGLTRTELGRDKFIELANEWKNLKRVEMKSQLDRLGLTLDYDREYFTMDETSSLAVQSAFKQLFTRGIIYRSPKEVFWCNSLQSTLSDIEVEKVDGVDKYIRTGENVERRLVTQWFINAKDMAHQAVEVVENSSIEMIPPNYKRSWSSWLTKNGVKDWCISRQSWWGHRIPAYKVSTNEDIQENWVVADNVEEASQLLSCSVAELMQDPDVLDTWFSSSLLPLTVAGWPCCNKFEASKADGIFPLDVMETGFDILNYWVSKMVMMSLALTSEVPFKLILLHGMICDSEGKKMSKSKGNVIDPINVIEGATLENLQDSTRTLHSQGMLDDKQLDFVVNNQKKLFPNGIAACGSDGLRAYLLSHDIHEEVVRVQIVQIEKVRRLSNKIWNIYRFVFNILDETKDLSVKLEYEFSEKDYANFQELDQQLLHELSKCIEVAHKSFYETYQLQHCFNALEYFWNVHLSSNYISNIKSILTSVDNDTNRHLKLQVLVTCLATSTRLLHPFMPHITEYLYQKLTTYLTSSEKNEEKLDDLRSVSFEAFPKVV